MWLVLEIAEFIKRFEKVSKIYFANNKHEYQISTLYIT